MHPSPRRGLAASLLFALAGGCAGGCAAAIIAPFDHGPLVYARLPHHVPPSPDAAPFRFAMVHDVIHERYPRHGLAYYEEMERLARERLAVLHPDSDAALSLTDDIAVGLDRRGRTDEAIALMRDKLSRQQPLDLPDKDLYSSYANLGEFLIGKNLRPMLADEPEARRRVEEGRWYLRRSLTANPGAHFGREAWQLVAIDMLLEFGERPELMRQCDLVGNRLDGSWGHDLEGYYYTVGEHGRPYDYEWTMEVDPRTYAPAAPEEEARKHITEVGRETGPRDSEMGKHGRRAPFDEPAMWLIGEWRQGSGPNPHFALCLGEIMLRVGQRFLAWNCYERAARLADQFSPTPDLQKFLREHCAARQAEIEKTLSPTDVSGLHRQFEVELAFGEAYQHDFQTYTEQKIAAGASLNDVHFFDEFYVSRPPIASKVGPEEWYIDEGKSYGMQGKRRAFWSWGLLVAGACFLLGAGIVRIRNMVVARRRDTEITPPP